MKKLSLFALAAAGLFFAACSEKDVVDEVQRVNVEEDGNQFIALDINLPVDNSFATRNSEVTDDNNYEDNNFELNDGLVSEYTVQDATLIVFTPSTADDATEDDATFVAAYDLNPEPWKMSDDHQVTDYSTKIVQKVGTTVKEGDLALVILNKNALVGFSTDGKFQVGGTDFSGTFKALKETIVSNTTGASTAATEMNTNGFFMANAPLADKAGSTNVAPTGAKLQTLVEITNVYETEEEARAGECAEIYVERGMAKVTVAQAIATPTLTTQYNGGATAAPLNLTIDGWVLDQTNQSSYLVRSTEGHSDFLSLLSPKANKYRYIGKSEITEGNPDTYKYRTYFAKDPNYTAEFTTMGEAMGGLKALATTAVDDALVAKFGDDYPQYCFENTFDVAHQSVNNTTLVRLKVTAKTGTTGEDLYIVNGNKSVIYKEADVIALIQAKALELVKAAGVLAKDEATEIATTDFTVTLDTRTATGYKNIKSITFNIAAKVSDDTKDKIPTAADLLADVKLTYKDNEALLCYEGGVSYYTIRVKHFGDQLTPWKTWEGTTGFEDYVAPTLDNGSYPGFDGEIFAGMSNYSTADKSKAAAANNYLGRYGMLRNNWYDIKVKDIKYLGEAVPASYTGDSTPDDEIDGYIAVQINILSWAKRTQQWSL